MATPERMMYVITDWNGNPLFLRSSAAGGSIAESIGIAASHAKAAGGANTFVLGTQVSPGTMAALVNDGVHFIVSADEMLDEGDLFGRVITELADDWSVRVLGSSTYYVLEFGMGILREGDGVRAMFGRLDGLDAPIKLRVAMWYDQDEYESAMGALSRVSRRRADALRRMSIESAREYLADGGPESRFISVHENDDGSVGVSIHRKMRRQIALRSSIHMFISDHMSWEDGMRCIGIRRDVLSHMAPIVPVAADGGRWSGSSYIYLAFVAMMIRMALERTVRDRGIGDMSADEVFQVASAYGIVNVNGHLYRSAITREAESLFEALDIDTGAMGDPAPVPEPETSDRTRIPRITGGPRPPPPSRCRLVPRWISP